MQSQVSVNVKTLMAAPCWEYASEAPTAEEMLDRVVCSRGKFSFQMCHESGDGW